MEDAAAEDTTSDDVAITDGGGDDTLMTDAAMGDMPAGDAAIEDAAMADMTAEDAAIEDATVGDISMEDSAMDDAAMDDAAMDDAASSDADADMAMSDAGGAPSWGPFTPLGCKKLINKNADGTVNPFISPARDGQFYVSWVQKSGDMMLTWELPSSCQTTEGPMQVNTTPGDVYYWGGIGVVSDLDGNLYAVWESKTKGAEISLAWSTTGKNFSLPLEVVSTSKNGQDPVLYVDTPGKVHAAWRGLHPTKSQHDPWFATSTNLLNTGKFTAGVPLADTAGQDDQVAMGVDSKGHIYYAWQTFDGDIYVAKSTNDGSTWSAGVQINDVDEKANVGKATFLVVTPDDRVVVMWSDERNKKSGNENDVFADSSADGITWGVDVQVNDDDDRYQQDPSMAVGKGPGCSGAVYAVWQDFRSKKSHDIYMARSTDGGLSWSKNEPIANDLEGDEMNPAIAVDSGCVIGVAWRDGTKNNDFDIGLSFVKW